MAIEFIVEDNTGLANATSYLSVADFKQYWENRGILLSELDATYQAWLNEATYFIDNNFNFCGKKLTEDQALKFPNTIYDEVPKQVKNALCEIAYSRQADASLSFIQSGIKSKKIGSVSITFQSMSKSDIKKQYSAAYIQLRQICQVSNKYVIRV